MSVLVKGMKMPDSCYHCKIAESCGHYIANYTDRRHPDCPLIALPEHHGRLVDADALRDRLRSLADDGWNKSTTTSWAEAFSECEDMVDDAPTIEPQRKKGHWIRHPEQRNIFNGKTIECSECHEKYTVQYVEDEWFCRHCGADMREDGAECQNT